MSQKLRHIATVWAEKSHTRVDVARILGLENIISLILR